ncbi:helix-turn-helix domain-containing protein [Zavarzinia aquatilis]|uniref:Transcriptional regulator n=1 Tax=Zavarzinia aquatilis TaxID=2211142 RepID=A0A317ED53_9PROT|nr:helix-turn-helix domain-containing protein [Zavarzinia aquatilis]PWR24958.1 transcriptional regulator [Zavarzinia aquatilis]
MTDTPNPIDIQVGARVKLRRQLLGLSQTDLADSLGLTFQQVQKYEKGTNRVSASKLYQLSQTLDVPVAFFFDGLGGEAAETAEVPALTADAVRLVAAFETIHDQAIRAQVVQITRAISAAQPAAVDERLVSAARQAAE